MTNPMTYASQGEGEIRTDGTTDEIKKCHCGNCPEAMALSRDNVCPVVEFGCKCKSCNPTKTTTNPMTSKLIQEEETKLPNKEGCNQCKLEGNSGICDRKDCSNSSTSDKTCCNNKTYTHTWIDGTPVVHTLPSDKTWRQDIDKDIEEAYPDAYRLARRFHELYEETAPKFGYKTREDTTEFKPASPNGRTMAYVCKTVVDEEVESLLTSATIKAKIQERQKIQDGIVALMVKKYPSAMRLKAEIACYFSNLEEPSK